MLRLPERYSFAALRLAFIAVGFAALVAQVVLTREFLVVLGGNELCIGLILASWLFGIFIGAWAGALPADRRVPRKTLFLLALLFLAVALPVQLIAVRGARGLLGVPPGEAIPFLAALLFCPLVTAPSSLAVGFAFPFAARLGSDATGGSSRGVADLYIAESAGSLAGGLVFTFILVELLKPMQLAVFSAAWLAVGGFFVSLTFAGRLRRTAFATVFVAIVFACGLALPGAARRWDADLELRRWRENAGDIELTASADSRYQHLAVGKLAEQYNLYANGSLSGFVPADYTHAQLAHFIMCQHPRPRSLLLIGDGTEGLLPAVLEHGIELVDYTLLDEKVLGLLEPHMSAEQKEALRDGRVNLRITDGRRFLQTTRRRYDVIIALLPPPSSALLNRYYTLEFILEARAHLEPDGLLVMPLPLAPNYRGGLVGAFAGSIASSLHSAFPEMLISYEPQSLALCASRSGVFSADPRELATRWRKRGISNPGFHESLFTFWLEPGRLAEIREDVLSPAPAEANTDFQPAAYLYQLLIWNRTTEVERGAADFINGVVLAMRAMSLWPFIIAVAVALVAMLLARRAAGGALPRASALVVVATTGLTAMAIEIVVLYLYQSLFGYVYHEIGVIIALFMAGLAIGALFSRNTPSGRLRGRLLSFEVILMALCAGVPILASLGPSLAILPFGRFVFAGLAALAGFLTGAEFPLAITLYCGQGRSGFGAGAGALDAADHLGAAAGALLTGVFLVPVLGVWLTIGLLVCLKAASAITLWLCAR